MKNKGFTLVELLAVIVIIVVISIIAFPNISEAIKKSNNDKYTNYEEIIKSTMDLYVQDKKEDLFSGIQTGGKFNLTYDDLLEANSDLDIDLNVCEIKELEVERISTCAEPCITGSELYLHRYNYKVCIRCEENNNVYETKCN